MTDELTQMLRETRTATAEETQQLGARLGASLIPGNIVLLFGELGAGKTVFAKGIASGLGIDIGLVHSPTFTLMNVYDGRMRMVHLDLYRIETLAEAEQAGLLDVFDADAIVVIEWPDKVAEFCKAMPHVKVAIDVLGPDSRHIRISRNS